MEQKCEDLSQAVADSVFSKEKPASIEEPIPPPTSDLILACTAIFGIPFHVVEKMTKFVINDFTAQYKGLYNRLSAILESLIERIARRLVSPLLITAL